MWGGSAGDVPRRATSTSTSASISTLSPAASFPHTLGSRAATSSIAASAGSMEVPPHSDDGRLAETQEVSSKTIGMSESDLLALEAKVRAVGGRSESPFVRRSPLASTDTSISQAYTPISLPNFSGLQSHTPIAPVQIALHPCACQDPSLFRKLIFIPKCQSGTASRFAFLPRRS